MFWDKKTEVRHRVVVETEEITTHEFNFSRFISFVLVVFLLLSMASNRGHSSNNYQQNYSVDEDTITQPIEQESEIK